MKQNKFKKFIAKVTGKKQPKYVELSQFVANPELIGELGERVDLDSCKLYISRKNMKGFGQVYRFEDRKTEFYNSKLYNEYVLERMSKANPYMIDFGYFPQSHIDSWEVEELMNPQPTGRSYSRENYEDFIGDYCPEFRLENGKRVVRCDDKNAKESYYYEVEPVSWIIENGENIFKGNFENTDDAWGLNLNDLFHGKVKNMHLSPLSGSLCDGDRFSNFINVKQALVVAPELLKLGGVKNIDYLIKGSDQDECEKVL